MSTIYAAINELFKTRNTPSEISKLLKPHVSRSGVHKILKRLRGTESALPKVRSTPSRTVRTPDFIKKTQEKIRINPKRSIKKLSPEANVSHGTMQSALKIDLNLSPFTKSKAQVLSQPARAKR